MEALPTTGVPWSTICLLTEQISSSKGIINHPIRSLTNLEALSVSGLDFLLYHAKPGYTSDDFTDFTYFTYCLVDILPRSIKYVRIARMGKMTINSDVGGELQVLLERGLQMGKFLNICEIHTTYSLDEELVTAFGKLGVTLGTEPKTLKGIGNYVF